jgi:hypothetical protein
LNEKLQEDSEYILPENYKKVVEKQVTLEHSIKPSLFEPQVESCWLDCYEIVSSMLSEELGISLIEPMPKMILVAKAKLQQTIVPRVKKETS